MDCVIYIVFHCIRYKINWIGLYELAKVEYIKDGSVYPEKYKASIHRELMLFSYYIHLFIILRSSGGEIGLVRKSLQPTPKANLLSLS